MHALEQKSFTGNQRSEFLRDICSNIASNGVYFLDKVERNQVASAIVHKYPHLKDLIGSGMVNLTFFLDLFMASR